MTDKENIMKALECRINQSIFTEQCEKCTYFKSVAGIRVCDYMDIFRDAYRALGGKEGLDAGTGRAARRRQA